MLERCEYHRFGESRSGQFLWFVRALSAARVSNWGLPVLFHVSLFMLDSGFIRTLHPSSSEPPIFDVLTTALRGNHGGPSNQGRPPMPPGLGSSSRSRAKRRVTGLSFWGNAQAPSKSGGSYERGEECSKFYIVSASITRQVQQEGPRALPWFGRLGRPLASGTKLSPNRGKVARGC